MKKHLTTLFFIISYAFFSMTFAQSIVINSTEDNVYLYDDFDIIGSPINANNGNSGRGWNGNWQIPSSNGMISVSQSNLNYPSSTPLMATGKHAYSASVSGQGISRQLQNPIKLGETTTFYVSFLTKKNATGNYRIDGLTATGSSAGFAVGVTPNGSIKVNAGNTAGWGAVTTQTEAGVIDNDVTYLMVARYHYDNGQSSVEVSAFKEGDELPTDDASYTWDYKATGGSLNTTINAFRLAFSKGIGRIDEFRLGSTWASVTSLDISEPELAVSAYRFPSFDWEDHPSQFADMTNPVSYEIQIATDEQFSAIVDEDEVLLSRYVHDKPFDEGVYFWRTRSITYGGETSSWADTKTFTVEAPETLVTVPLPSGQEDCTSSVQDAVTQAQTYAESGQSVKVIFPAGDYYFGESLIGEVISLNNVKNIEIEGTGAIFHFSARNQGLIEASGCKNISISGINVTYAKGLFRVQGHVVSVNQNDRTAIVSIENGSPDFSASSSLSTDIFILLDPETDGRIKDLSSNFYRMSSFQDNGNDTYTVNIADGGDFEQWEVGDRFVYHFRSGSKAFVDFGESQDVTTYNITTDGWGAMGFVSVKGSNFNILNCTTQMQEGKWMMGNADGIHVREHKIGPWIEGLDMQATGDDGLAFYARSIAMTSVKPNGNEQSAICVSTYFNLEKGDEVAFFQPKEGRIILETTVKSVEEITGGYSVVFADALPDGIITGSPLVNVTQIWNRSKSCGEFMVRDSKFINNRRYANVFRSKRGVIENTEYRGASTRAIHFRNETAHPNGLYASEIILRNNHIEDCSFDGSGTQSPISFKFESSGGVAQSIGPRNILIEDNTIKDCPSPEIELIGANHVVIRGNTVIASDGETSNATYKAHYSGNISDVLTLHPTADAFVQGGSSADQNFGTQTVLTAKDDTDANNKRSSFLKFDLSTITDLTAEKVILRLKTASISGNTDNLSAYFIADDTWEETAINWNNKPASGTLLDTKTNTASLGEWIELDVTSQVITELSGDKKFSVLLMSGESILVSYHSREAEAENQPQLVLKNETGNVEMYKVTSSAEGQGTISPSGEMELFANSSQVFNFSPNTGFEVADVLVDGISQGSMESYKLNNITSDQTVHVIFQPIEGATILSVEADAYVQGGSFANTNYGTDEALVIKSSATEAFIRQSYLRFDLSTLEEPVTSAKLRLKLKSGEKTTHSVKFVNDDSWGETTINWTNKPDNGDILNTQDSPIINGWIELDVTDKVEEERNGDGKISFALTDETLSELLSTYYSKEAGADLSPKLLILTNTNVIQHAIQVTAGSNGTITPTGEVMVDEGENQNFSITANIGYEIADVLVDGVSKGALSNFEFTNVTNAHTIEATFQAIENTSFLTPEADASVYDGTNENTNYGTVSLLAIRTVDTPSFNRKSYLRFDLSDLDGSVIEAKLRLNLASINGSATTHHVMFVSDDSWGETTINWVNKPNEGAVLNSQSTPTVNNWIEFDVTDKVEAERSNDGKISFVLADASTSQLLSAYHSREAGTDLRPQLYLITDGIPPLAIDETLAEKAKVSVYPNPVSSQLTVNFNNTTHAHLTLVDLYGRVVLSQPVINGKGVVSVAHLAKGIYILKVACEEKSYMQKIMINH